MATVGIVPSVISCETSSRRGAGSSSSRPRASRRGSTGGILVGITQLQSDEMAMAPNDHEGKPRRRASNDGASSYTPTYRRSSNEVLDILSTALHKNEHATSIPRELLDLDVSPTVLQESLQVAETTAKQQRQYSTSNISADVWKPKVKASDDSKSSGSGRRSEPPVTKKGTNGANRSERSTKSSQQSLDQHKVFTSSHRAANNVPGRRHRGNSPTSNPTITNSAITSRRRNSAPCGENTMKRQKPPPIEEIVFTPQEITLPTEDVDKTILVDPRDDEIEDLQQAAKSSQRSIQVLSNEIRMLKEANKRLARERQEQEEAWQKEIADLKNELKACYKKNICLSKSSRADAATIERLQLELDGCSLDFEDTNGSFEIPSLLWSAVPSAPITSKFANEPLLRMILTFRAFC